MERKVENRFTAIPPMIASQILFLPPDSGGGGAKTSSTIFVKKNRFPLFLILL
jgi:hypothetical protein